MTYLEENMPLIWHVCKAKAHSYEHVKDLVQETCRQFLKSNMQPRRTSLYYAMRSAYQAFYKLDREKPAGLEVEDYSEHAEHKRHIGIDLSCLNDEDAYIIERWSEGWSYADIGKETGMPTNHVWWRRNQAIKHLRKHMNIGD